MNSKTCAWCGEPEMPGFLRACGKEHYENIWAIPLFTRSSTKKTQAYSETAWLRRSLDQRKRLSQRADAVKIPQLYTV